MTLMQINAGQSVQIIDLSVTLAESAPCTWPGHKLFAHKNWKRLTPDNPYQTNFIIMDEHCGTHFDASTHFIPPADSGLPFAGPLGNNTGEKVCLENLIGPAVVIDVRFLHRPENPPGISPAITVEHMAAWEAENGPIQKGEIVLFWTGWDRYYKPGIEGQPYVQGTLVFRDTPGWPAPEVEVVLYLHEKGVKTIGIDAASLGAAQNGIPVHQEGLKRDLIYIEGLTHLEKLPSRGALFLFLPLKIAGSSGCPGRAIAIVAKGEQ
jgi:kynurenine formamidase